MTFGIQTGPALIAFLLAGTAMAQDLANPLMSEDGAFWAEMTPEKLAEVIAAGADIHERDAYGTGPLMLAMEYDAPNEVVFALIDAGVAVNQVGGKGSLPTLWAAYTGNVAIMQAMKAAGADFNVVNYLGDGPQHWLAYNANFDPAMIDFLIAEGVDMNAQSRTAETPASLVGWNDGEQAEAMFDALIAAGSDPTGISAEGQDSFMKAISYAGNGPFLERLYEMSEDPEAANNAGLSGILLASQWGINQERLEFLEAKGFDLWVETPRGENAIFLNATYGDMPSMQLLLDRGFDINSDDDAGNTVLHRALDENEPLNITGIIAAGANTLTENAKGVTPLMLALAHPYDAADTDRIAVTDALLASGAVLNDADNAGTTTLIYAIKGNQPVARLQQIIDAGADVNAVDAEGTTALMHAAMLADDAAVIELLVSAGADIAITDVFDDTAAVMLADNTALAGNPVIALLQ